MKPTTTKEDLLTENATLKEKINRMEHEDFELRTEFSKILDTYTPASDTYFVPNKKPEISSWMEIAGLIGELKADANYSCVIAAREELKSKLHGRERYISHLENQLSAFKRGEKPEPIIKDLD